jgi:glutamine amidotransferase
LKNVAIIDYSIGNLFSVQQACKEVGLNPFLVSRIENLKSADALILPGVGAFGQGMENLKSSGLDEEIKAFIQTGKPFMGICLGMQLLLEKSEEFGDSKGLGIIPGTVRKLPKENKSLPVPKITWDEINKKNISWENTPLKNINNKEDFYFVHSYYCELSSNEFELSYTTHGELNYCSSILKDNVFATQYHPEKSSKSGLQIYQDWKDLN